MQRREFLRSMTLLAATGMIRPRLGWSSRIVAPFDVYLTFDDGPFAAKNLTGDYTDNVIRILKEHNAVATFFLLGRRILPYNGPALARYLSEGHHIGSIPTLLTPEATSLEKPRGGEALQSVFW